MSASAQPSEPSFDWLTLEDEETVIWSGKPHKASLIPAIIIGLPLAVVLIGIGIMLFAYLYRENTSYVVTTRALYTKTGVLSRDVQRVDFGKVQNTSYQQGVVGSQFGYGTVEISTAGGSGVEMAFRSVPDPRQLQERINQRVNATSKTTADTDSESPEDVLDDMLTELQAIRHLLETDQPSHVSSHSGESHTEES